MLGIADDSGHRCDGAAPGDSPSLRWSIDRREYGLVCAYLGLTSDGAIFERLVRYLAQAPLRPPRPHGRVGVPPMRPITAFRLARLDLASRIFWPDHPIRHVLNAVLALHECDGRSFREMSRAVTGPGVWLELAGWGLRLAFSAVVTLSWLAAGVPASLIYRATGRTVDLGGWRVLITGVGRGLGLDLMLECLERGASVIGTVRSEVGRDDLMRRLPSAAPVTLLVADLAVAGAASGALDAADVDPTALDMVILCAGTKREGSSVLAVEAVRETLQVNFLACVELAAWLVDGPVRGKREDAGERPARTGTSSPQTRLVAVSSMGRWHGMHSTAGYNASKAALSIWAESLELQLSCAGRFTVTVVEPGLFESGMTRRSGLMAALLVPRRAVAGRILDAAAAGRRVVRSPYWFALLTWGLCLAGRGVRQRLLARVKSPANGDP